MKKFYILLSFLAIGFSAKAVPTTVENFNRPFSGDAFIFIERGVEFAVFPDGQFDFFFNPRGNFNRVPAHINYSYNSGYNYGPFVQYDDYGAVIQIENVPVYYDYYGRIVRAGRVKIGYNAFGMVNRVGNMFVHYNHYDQFTHTSGFINSRNVHYVYRPWHQHYMRPHTHVIVYHQPYRLYYTPNRMKYTHYKRYYNDHYRNNSFQKSYYQPGERVTTYHRGRRDETPREVRTAVSESQNSVNDRQQRNINRPSENRNLPAQRMERRTIPSRVENPAVQRSEVQQSRSSRVENTPVERSVKANVPARRAETPAVERRNISENKTPSREVQAQSRSSRTSSRENVAPQTGTAEPAASRSSRSSRGGN